MKCKLNNTFFSVTFCKNILEMIRFGSLGIINLTGLVNVALILTSSPFSSRIENETNREKFVMDGI
jgi:hypothetical protein